MRPVCRGYEHMTDGISYRHAVHAAEGNALAVLWMVDAVLGQCLPPTARTRIDHLQFHQERRDIRTLCQQRLARSHINAAHDRAEACHQREWAVGEGRAHLDQHLLDRHVLACRYVSQAGPAMLVVVLGLDGSLFVGGCEGEQLPAELVQRPLGLGRQVG